MPAAILAEDLAEHPEYASLRDAPEISLDIRYASARNFLGYALYGNYCGTYLHWDALAKLKHAAQLLQARHPALRLCILDALRPARFQTVLWNHVKGTPQQDYVADPAVGSMHRYGMAVDLTLVDADGVELDMGTLFDDFSPLAEPQQEDEFLASGALRPEHITNRRILRSVMTEAGFEILPYEWWHFNALDNNTIRIYYAAVE